MRFPSFVLLTCFLSVLAPVNLAAESGPVFGTVSESIDSGGYTYILIKESDTWIATTSMQVSEGTVVEYSGGMEMKNFYSKSLDRTFESIWFVNDVSVSGQDLDQLHQRAAQDTGSTPPSNSKPTAITAPAPGEIEQLDGGSTVEKIMSDPAAFNGQTASLRARVIKVNSGIMGKNWITLQDGTGVAPNNKLIATSTELVAVGEIVTARGVVHNDVDLGSGYHYAALLEDTTFVK